ncbi:MAG: hypothetical protein QGI15_05495, partial [Candidatus Scalindua sp.]|nr:hypothetical protein [Candidatus Scalindua sp.]
AYYVCSKIAKQYYEIKLPLGCKPTKVLIINFKDTIVRYFYLLFHILCDYFISDIARTSNKVTMCPNMMSPKNSTQTDLPPQKLIQL